MSCPTCGDSTPYVCDDGGTIECLKCDLKFHHCMKTGKMELTSVPNCKYKCFWEDEEDEGFTSS